DAVELDVHATSDGVVVVHHDPDFGGRAIAEMTHADVARVVLAINERVPTLAAVLDAVAQHGAVYVEIKGSGIEARVVDVIRKCPAPQQCAVHSFDHAMVRRARALAPELTFGILVEDRAGGDLVAQMRAAHATDVWPHYKLVDSAMVAAIHDAGGRVITWTVNEERLARRLAAAGVDGLCSDAIPLVRQALSFE
ncbi:MAG: glycerophosphodiester phosphodiesterase, partial [Gemmatimonadota bacterium]|nr:glycerophosphodiester phosphodiesterase [Gemmatimonadota bacterium]